jgi:hypothetical protein
MANTLIFVHEDEQVTARATGDFEPFRILQVAAGDAIGFDEGCREFDAVARRPLSQFGAKTRLLNIAEKLERSLVKNWAHDAAALNA